ncbi:hypothetical protein Tsubulata_003353 [Turnera subulata]|uniref:Alpha/beta hydrolase fold-3 domain-containing protein n=1 Tax=Turnera subulata TaxID=218843 RepID=A0A9Q0GG91_9ROSI|nr:hypothetical protein Tsubulata_003353 [Turnera subulata]
MSNFYNHLHLKIHPDGTVTRMLSFPLASADPDFGSPDSPAAIKDFPLNPEKKTSVRLYIPSKLINTKTNTTSNDNDNENKGSGRLPIVIFFQGNVFVMFSTDNLPIHKKCTKYVNFMPAIVVLVGCCLAPEHRIPTQYDDAIDALQWVKKQVLDPNGEPWLKDYGDPSRCFMHGDDSGGNIVYHSALRAMGLDLSPLKVVGLILNQPLFGGMKRKKSELKYAGDHIMPVPALDLVWELALPKGTDRDHRYCNPLVDEPIKEMLHKLPRCLVFGFGMAPLVDRQQDFVEMLAMNGVNVEAHFDQVGFYRIDAVDQKRAEAMSSIVKEFINS